MQQHPLDWLAAHKTQAGIGAAAAVGALALYQRHKSSTASAPASTVMPASTTSSGTLPTVGYDSSQLDQYNQLAGAISNLNDQVSTLQAGNQTAAASSISPPSTGFNPYTPGTVVAPGEKVIASQAGPNGTWVDLTDQGGLYTTGGEVVSGSGYKSTPLPGSTPYSIQVAGNQVFEDTGTGVKTFTLAQAPTINKLQPL